MAKVPWLQTVPWPTRGGTAGSWQRLFPCLLWQGTKCPPLSRRLKPQVDNLLALCRSSSLSRCWTSTNTAFMIKQQYLNGQHSDGQGSCKIHVGLKGVQDHSVAALGGTEHSEIHMSNTRSCSLSTAPQALTEQEEPWLLAGQRGAAGERHSLCKGKRLSTKKRALWAHDRQLWLTGDTGYLFKAKAGDSSLVIQSQPAAISHTGTFSLTLPSAGAWMNTCSSGYGRIDVMKNSGPCTTTILPFMQHSYHWL